MKCSWCKKDYPYWSMTPMPLTEEQKTYPTTPAKDIVCDRCLGIKKTRKYLVALPAFPNDKGFNHQTVLVSATDENDAIDRVIHLKGNRVNIGDIKIVNY